jgi:AAA domain-containing protein/bifunctional DNA primase/polymerase-like protein
VQSENESGASGSEPERAAKGVSTTGDGVNSNMGAANRPSGRPEGCTRDDATGLLRAGFALVLVPVGKKAPEHKAWNSRAKAITRADQLPMRLNANLGLLHAFSDPPTFALDIDNYQAAHAFLEREGIDLNALMARPDAVQIRSQQPNRGKVLYRLPAGEAPIPSVDLTDRGDGLEFRCGTVDGRSVHDLLPPSLHPSGTRYAWAGAGDYSRLSEIPPALLALAKRLHAQPMPHAPVNGNAVHVTTPEGRHADMLKLAMSAVRTAKRMGGSIESAIAMICAERDRGRWPGRHVDDGEIERAVRGAWAKHDAPGERAPEPPANEDDDRRADPLLPVTGSKAPLVSDYEPRERANGCELVDGSTLQPRAIAWDWPGFLAGGKFHALAGPAGTLKTTIAVDYIACVTAGRALPDGHVPPLGSAVIWSGEDDPADTLAPRLLAAGADLTRVKFVGDVTEDGKRYPFDPSRDVPKLAAAIAVIEDLRVIVIDPIVNAVAGDSHKNGEVRRGLAPLVDLAARTGAVLIGITHYSKGTQGREPLERVTGSLAFGALARIVHGTVRMADTDESSERRFLFARVKSNIGPDGGGFEYGVESVPVPGYPGLHAPRIKWGAAVEGTARELLAGAEYEPDPGERSASSDAVEWLRGELLAGERDAGELMKEAERFGFSSKVTRTAREKLGIKPRKRDFAKGWVWALPIREGAQPAPEGAQDAQAQSVGALGILGAQRAPSDCPKCGGEGCGYCEAHS